MISAAAIDALRRSIVRLFPWRGGDKEPVTLARSRAFAEAMRARGWIAEEGYAPESWAK